MKRIIDQVKYLLLLAFAIFGIWFFLTVVDSFSGVSDPQNGDWNSPIENPSYDYP